MARIIDKPEWLKIVKYLTGETTELDPLTREWLNSNQSEVSDLSWTYNQSVIFDTEASLKKLHHKINTIPL